jgi:hypothetical protein
MTLPRTWRDNRGWGASLASGLLALACASKPSDAPADGFADDSGSSPTGGSSADPMGSGGSTALPGAGGTGVVAPGAGGVPEDCESESVGTAPTVLRRLSVLEYQLTTQDLLSMLEPPSSEGLPLDNEHLGFRTFAEHQTMSAENLRAYLDKASSLAGDLLASPERRSTVIGCEPTEPQCLSDFVARFGKLAYRRALEANEVDAIATAATEFGADADDGIRFAIEAMLSSAQFLYRVEVGDNPEGLSTLTPHELASRLSFALWGRGPTGEQLDQAASGALDSPEGLALAAQSMLQDDKTQVFFEAFFRQWLGYQTLRPSSPEHEAVASDMQLETDRVVTEFAWGAGNFFDALLANHTYVSPELAAFYGSPAPDVEGRVAFEEGDPRFASGLLTHAALLSAKTDGDIISTRGNWLRKTFLCQELHIPEDLADTIGELLVGLDRIAIVEERNTRASCMGCHSTIDPIGIGLAKFDRAGIFDPEEDVSVFGITPALPDAPEPNTFNTVGELSAHLYAMSEVPVCLTERAYLYMNGREPAAEDACSVVRTSGVFLGGGHDFSALLQGIVDDPSFRLRRPPAPTP